MSWRRGFNTGTLRTARREYECDANCGQPIARGEEYINKRHTGNIYGGYTSRYHYYCVYPERRPE